MVKHLIGLAGKIQAHFNLNPTFRSYFWEIASEAD
jgi:hypothetical protein